MHWCDVFVIQNLDLICCTSSVFVLFYLGHAIEDNEISDFEPTTGNSYLEEQSIYDVDMAKQNRRLIDDNMLLKDQLRQAEDVTSGLVLTIEALERDKFQ